MSRLGWRAAVGLFCAASALAQNPVTAHPARLSAATPRLPLATHNYTGEAAVIERIRTAWRFENDGSGQEVQYLRVRVQTQAAIQVWGQLIVNYNAATDRVHVDFVRVHKPDGRVVTAGPDAVQDLSSPVSRIAPVYTDMRQLHITVPDLSVGDTLEYEFSTHLIHPLIPGQFFLDWNFSKQAITLDQTLAVNVPADRRLHVKTSNGVAPPAIVDRGGRRIYTWNSSFTHGPAQTGDESAGSNEVGSPEFADVALSTFDNWAQVGSWYAALERPRAAVTPAIRAEAAALIKGHTTALGKVRATYDYVSEQVRYVSLSFGIGAYQPHAAGEVLANLYGDCKDKATLFQALLAAEGIEAYPVLINAEGKVDRDVPSPSQFDHVINIVTIDGKNYWADTTPGVTPFGFLVPDLRDKWALTIPASGPPRLVRTPQNPPFLPQQTVDVEGKVDSSGDLQGTFSYSATGEPAVFLRAVLARLPDSAWSKMAKALVSVSVGSGATVKSYHFADSNDLDQPLRLSVSFADPGFLNMSAKKTTLTLPVKGIDLPDVSRPVAGKVAPLDLGVIHEDAVNWKIQLPASLTVTLPVPVHVTRNYAGYQSLYAATGPTMTIMRHLVIRDPKIPSTAYDGFKAFHSAVKADEAQVLSFVNAAPGAAPISSSLTARELDARGYSAYRAGNYPEAERLFKAAVAKDARLAYAWNDLGLLYNSMGEYAKAVPALQKAIAADPYNPYAYNNLGQSERGLGDDKAAISDFEKQIAIDPLDKYAHANLAQVYLSEKKYALALPEYQTALKITPGRLDVYVGLGDVQLSLGQGATALDTFQAAMRRFPTPNAWNDVAYILAKHRVHLHMAERLSENSILAVEGQLSGTSLDTVGAQQTRLVLRVANYWDTMGWILFREGDMKGAEAYVHAGWMVDADLGMSNHLCQIYKKEGKGNDAICLLAGAHPGASRPVQFKPRLQSLSAHLAEKGSRRRSSISNSTVRRGVELPDRAGLNGQAEFWILLAPQKGPLPSGWIPARIANARFLDGDGDLRAFIPEILSAHLPYNFPTAAPTQLPLRAILYCNNLVGSCRLVIFPAGATLDALLAHRSLLEQFGQLERLHPPGRTVKPLGLPSSH